MADKKITVLGDAADEPLTPEEEHKIEVKIDKMLAPDTSEVSDESKGKSTEVEELTEPAKAEAPAKKSSTTVKPKIEKKNAKILPLDDEQEAPSTSVVNVHQAATIKPIEDEPTEEETASKTAPPLPKKAGKKVSITVKHHDDPELEEAEAASTAEEPTEPSSEVEAESKDKDDELAEELAPEKLPKKPLKIAINEPEPVVAIPEVPAETETETEPDEVEAEESEPETTTEPELEEATPELTDEPEVEAETAEESTEEVDLAAEPVGEASTKPKTKKSEKSAESTAEESAEPQAKKYRPPDGPLPFKRAEPELEPPKPAGSAVDELSAEDAALTKAFEPSPTKKTHRLSLPHPKVHAGKKVGKTIIVLIILLVAAAALVPQLRAMALNLAQVHGSLSMSVLDSTTHKPLSEVSVQVAGQKTTTDASGKATFNNLRLGTTTLQLQKPDFGPVSKSIYVSWGSKSLGSLSLQPLGSQYSFVINDYVTGQPITGATAKVGDSESQSNNKGLLSLVVASAPNKTVTLSAKGYKSATLSLPNSTGATTVSLVPAQEDLYIGKGSGKFNVYAVGLDGQNVRLVLAGSGSETSKMSLVPNDDGAQAVLVSTRDSLRDKAGYLLDTLTLIKTGTTPASTMITHGQQIKVVGWFGTRLVYTVLKADVASSDATRYQLFSYDTSTNKATELDHANNFNDVVAADGAIYYATSNHSSSGTSQLLKIAPDGTNKQTLLPSEVTSILRTGYSDLILATAGKWYSLKLGSNKPIATNTTASSSRLYVDSQDGAHSAWVDQQSGKLYLYSKTAGSESVLAQQSGLVYPIRWLSSNLLVYRVSTPVGVWDYAVGIHGGTPKKITSSVLDLNGLALWHN